MAKKVYRPRIVCRGRRVINFDSLVHHPRGPMPPNASDCRGFRAVNRRVDRLVPPPHALDGGSARDVLRQVGIAASSGADSSAGGVSRRRAVGRSGRGPTARFPREGEFRNERPATHFASRVHVRHVSHQQVVRLDVDLVALVPKAGEKALVTQIGAWFK